MYNISYKYKHFFFLLVKLAIVIAAGYLIYQKLTSNQLLSFPQIQQQLSVLFSNSIWVFLLVLLFTDANWILEIFKWKTLTSVEKKITFFEAYEQCLASLTASIITPNRIGEYGAKALFFEKNLRKKIVVLNFVGNLSQLSITLAFGVFGLLFLIRNFTLKLPVLNPLKFVGLFVFFLVIYFFRKKLKVYFIVKIYFQKTKNYLKQIPKNILLKTVGFSLLRYLIFAHQFYFLLLVFGSETNYFTTINLLFCVYFIASIIPSLSIFDWVIKGSVALFIFSFINLNELLVVTVTTFMWLLNFALPALIGSIFVLKFKFISVK